MKDSWLSRIVTWWAIAGGVFVLAIVLVTTTNVTLFALDRVARPFGGVVSGLPGYEDFVSLAVSCAALMFFPICQLRRGHVAVDVFTEKLPARWQNALDRLWSAVACLGALFLGYWMAIGMEQVRGDHASSPVIGWAVWPFYLPGILSLFLWAVVAALQVLERRADGRP
ncbi:MAG TPA: TRAP transporter small permease [Dongiaceae bacterium]|jgi:TRAP-type C4-dicarboxylate transport system permease small subunit|nr:TRAP transporter small permease [Dongiaceae bacterium]